MTDPFVQKYGVPKWWACPDCGVRFLVFPALPFDHEKECRARPAHLPSPKVGQFYFVHKPNLEVEKVCIANAYDPTDEQAVTTRAPDGAEQKWAKRWEGDVLAFYPPDGYAPFDQTNNPVWRGNKLYQTVVAAPLEVMERMAAGGRKSVTTG